MLEKKKGASEKLKARDSRDTVPRQNFFSAHLMPNALLAAGDAQGLIHRGFIEINVRRMSTTL